MRCDSGDYILEVFSGGAVRWWAPGRVPDCPHRACRRARKCVRPAHRPNRALVDLPACCMITDSEWAAWSEMVLRILSGPPTQREKDLRAICDRHARAIRRERPAEDQGL